MKTLSIIVIFSCALVPIGHAQERGQIMIDVVENDRRCYDDGNVVRECHVAYGHVKEYPAPTSSSKLKLATFRVALLCERGERGRKDCIPLEAGIAYKYSNVALSGDYPYTWYGDFASAMYIVTLTGKALYAVKDFYPVREVGPLGPVQR